MPKKQQGTRQERKQQKLKTTKQDVTHEKHQGTSEKVCIKQPKYGREGMLLEGSKELAKKVFKKAPKNYE